MLKRLVAQAITSPALRGLRRGYAATRRRLRGKRPTVLYFHQVDDPYSHLAVQVLPALLDRYDVDVLPYLVPPPTPAAVALGESLWRGEAIAPAQNDGETAMAIGGALRQWLGHYLGATFYFEGE